MPKTKQLQKTTDSPSKRFTNLVINEFKNLPGSLQLTPYQKELIQHMFIKIQTYLDDPKTKKKSPPVTWDNINLPKLAINVVDRIALGLDALISNHIHPIVYKNNDKQGNFIYYNLTLQIGYIGWDYIKKTTALYPPKNIIYHLVYKNDEFEPLFKSKDQPYDEYVFQVKNAFDRGPLIGGFGYIEYEDKTKNKLVLVSEKEFLKSKERCPDPQKTFWKDFPEQMRFTKLVTRTTSDKNMPIDPKKTSLSYMRIQEENIMQEIDENANKEVLDIETEKLPDYHNEELPLPSKQQEENRADIPSTFIEEDVPEKEETDNEERDHVLVRPPF